MTSSLGVGGQPIIRKPELDAFLVTAFSPELRDDAFLDDLTLENITMRGVRLSVLFMQVPYVCQLQRCSYHQS